MLTLKIKGRMYRIEALGIQIYHFASQFLVVICGHGVTEHLFVTDSQSLLTSKVQSCILKNMEVLPSILSSRFKPDKKNRNKLSLDCRWEVVEPAPLCWILWFLELTDESFLFPHTGAKRQG